MPYFSKENARQFSAIGHKKRWDAYREAKATGQLPIKGSKAQKPPEPVAQAILPEDADKYPACRIGRVRMQLDRFDAMLLVELDPQKIDRLASATAKLAEQERILRGCPLPGSHRPKATGTAKRGQVAEPLE